MPLAVLLAGGSPIDLDASFFVQLAIFFVAFFMLRGLVFKPVMELFDARTAAMDGARTKAGQMEREAEETREKFESELRRARLQANENRDKLRNEAQKLARELTERARRENTATLSSAKAQLDLEARDVRKRLQTEVPALAQKIAEKLLGRSVG